MHVELLVPALLPGRPTPRRQPQLELLLARARRRDEAATTLERWLLSACGIADGEFPAGALTLAADGGEPADALWLRADPVHLLQRREMLVLVPPPSIRLTLEEARPLAAALSAHFGADFEIHALHPERWCARIRAGSRLEALAPLEAAGRNVDAVLPGGDAKRWHAVLNEAQMLLHAHPVNAARESRGERAVNSLWLWGLGRLPQAPRCPWQSVSADEALARGLARAGRVRLAALPAGAGDWLAQLPGEGRHLAVLEGLRVKHAFDDIAGWDEQLAGLESRWISPLVEALRTNRIGMITVNVPDATESRSYELARADLRRFWRRPRPLDQA